MTQGRRIELNPGEHFMVADRTILVREMESILADLVKIGHDEHQLAYLFTFAGKVNNRDEDATVTVAMSVDDAYHLMDSILRGLEKVMGKQE